MNAAPLQLQQPAQAEPVTGARLLPWGRWGLRTVAGVYLAMMILLPLAALVAHGLRDGIRVLWRDISNPIALAALRLTLLTAVVMMIINTVMGTLTAYVLVRYRFFGNRLLNSVIDLPFAIPTLVTGVMLVILYGPQAALGGWLEARGGQIIFAKPGIVLALLFVTYPFVIRAVQPVLMELEQAHEEAARTLGASPWLKFRQIN